MINFQDNLSKTEIFSYIWENRKRRHFFVNVPVTWSSAALLVVRWSCHMPISAALGQPVKSPLRAGARSMKAPESTNAFTELVFHHKTSSQKREFKSAITHLICTSDLTNKSRTGRWGPHSLPGKSSGTGPEFNAHLSNSCSQKSRQAFSFWSQEDRRRPGTACAHPNFYQGWNDS